MRASGPSGGAANPATFVITVPTAAIANYMLTTQDSDADTLRTGIPAP